MTGVKYINESVESQSDGVLLDEYARVYYDLHSMESWVPDPDALGAYARELRDEIVRRMRGNENG